MRNAPCALALLMLSLATGPARADCGPVPCHDYAGPAPLKAWLEIDPSGRLDYGVINPQLELLGNVGWMLTDYGPTLVSYDVSDPLHITRIRMKILPIAVSRLICADGRAYAGGEGLVICDVSNPNDARVLHQYSDPGATYRPICQRNGYLYIAVSRAFQSGELRVMDVRDPAQPQIVTTLGCAQSPVSAVSGDILVHGSEYNLTLVDISDAAHPVEVVTLMQGATALAVEGNHIYAGKPNGTRVLDISNPAAPVVVGSIPARDPLLMRAASNRLYVADRYEGMVTWDISEPTAPAPVSTIAGFFGIVDLERCGPYLLTTSRGAILHTVDPEIAPLPAPLLAESAMSLPFSGDLALDGHLAYVISHETRINRPYELRCLDIGDPASVRVLGQLTTSQYLNNPQVRGQYLICDQLVVLDVGDPMIPRQVAGPFAGASVVLRDSLAFLANGTEIRVFDVRDPVHPAHLGSQNLGFLASPMIGVGSLLVAASQNTIRILDARDPHHVIPMGSLVSPAGYCSALVAQGNLVYVAGEFGSMAIIDVSEPAAPRVRSFFETPDRSHPGSLAVGNGVVYLNNNSFGALVVDVSDPDRPSLLGVVPTAEPLINGTSQEFLPTALALADGYLLSVKASHGLRFAARQCGDVQPLVATELDVSPADACHRVGCGPMAKGIVTVAIVAADGFDPAEVDPWTVRFGPGGAAEYRGGADELVPRTGDGGADLEPSLPGAHAAARRLHDYDGDGDLDLIMRFAAAEAGIGCGDGIATLSGTTYGGIRLCGAGAITTSPDCDGGPGTPPAIALGDSDKATAMGHDAAPFAVAPALAPNPLNPRTELSFALAASARLRISVHDLAGRLLVMLADEDFAAGAHSLPWRGQDRAGRQLPSGVYFVRIAGGGIDTTIRAVMVR